MLRGESNRPSGPQITDFRGPNRRKVENPQTLLAPEQVTQLVAEYTDGTPVKVLANRYGIARQTVSEHARRAGAIRRPKVLDEAGVAHIVSLYESGLGIDRIGERVGVGPVRVRETLVGAGVQIRSCGGRTGYWVGRRNQM